MILQVSNVEAATLVIHMSVMRKSIRNMLKARNKADKKMWLAAYDYVLDSAKIAVDYQESVLNLNIRDTEILSEFIRAYKEQIAKDKTLNKALTEQDKQSLELLANIQGRCQELLQC